jgi:hypothetical protein
VGLLAAFVGWERRTTEPMIDLALFVRPRFLWGTVAATIASFALFGLLFVLPQYLQAVRGHDALGTGVRLLPMMAGLIVGAKAGERLATHVGTRGPVTAGLAAIAAGLAVGSLTTVTSGYGWVAGWLALIGIGTGLALAPAMDAVLGELPPQRSGSGTAVTMTLRQVGAALGVALLGSLASSAYTGRLHLEGLPAPAAQAARDSVAGAVAVATRLQDVALLADARAAYVHAMAVVLLACAGVAAAGAVGDERTLAGSAWDLDALERRYEDFLDLVSGRRPRTHRQALVAQVRLVQEWRRFPLLDPGLPPELLPPRWSGHRAAEVFRERHAAWAPRAQAAWTELVGQDR